MAGATADIQIAPVTPGIFQLDSAALAAANVVRVKADQSQSVESISQSVDLAAGQVYLALFGTGVQNATNVIATIGGQSVPVTYSGPQGSTAGQDQVNIGPLPRSLAGRGRVTLVLNADGQTANPVQFSVN